MNMIVCVFVVFFSLLYGTYGTTFGQERAKVLYTNPKYIKDVAAFTSKKSRYSPYVTSMNITTKVPFADNLTVRLEFTSSRFQAFPIIIDMKACEAFKLKWCREWVLEYSDMPPICPIKPVSIFAMVGSHITGTYYSAGFELPPKNFPLQFKNIDYSAKSTFFITETNEKVCELSIDLKFAKGG